MLALGFSEMEQAPHQTEQVVKAKWAEGSILAYHSQVPPDTLLNAGLDVVGRQLAIQCRAINQALATGRMDEVRPRQRAMNALANVSATQRKGVAAAFAELDATILSMRELQKSARQAGRLSEALDHAFVAAVLRRVHAELLNTACQA